MSDENPYQQFLPQQDENPYAQFLPKPEPNVKPLVQHFQDHQAEGLLETMEAGFQGSATGLAVRQKLPDLTMPEDAGFSQRMAFNAAQMVTDLPLMLAGGSAGAVVGAAIGGGVGSVVPVVGNAVGAGVGGVGGAGAGAFMLPTALREVMIDHYKNGSVGSWRELWDRAKPILLSTLKSGAVGATTGVVGKVAGPVAEAIAAPLAKTASPVVASGAKTAMTLASEWATMTNVGAWVDGRTATLRDYEDTAAFVFGFHAAKEGSVKLMEIYRQTGIDPKQVYADSRANPDIEVDLLTPGKAIPDAYAAAVDPEIAAKAAEDAAAKPTEEPATTAPPKPIEQQTKTGLSKIVSDIKDAFTAYPKFTEMKRIIGQYTGRLQQIDFDLAKKAKALNDELPADRQIAITNHIQAGGDDAVLEEREAASGKDHKQGYTDARNLTPREVEIANQIRDHQEKLWKLANDSGLLEAYVENYVRGQWEKPNEAGKKLLSMVNSGAFRTKPSEALQKVFANYFEGEQAGFKPTDKRIVYQWIAAERSMRQAIEAKKALTSMLKSNELDGRPSVVVGGAGVPTEGRTDSPYLVKPNNAGKDTADYRYLAHPALRQWKWVGQDGDGKPILLQGNMWLHPDAFPRVNALLSKSRIREYSIPKRVPIVGGLKPGKLALEVGAFIKGSILVGPFHQVGTAIHAVWHGTNPLTAKPIDFEARPVLKEGVEHGLQLVSHNAMQEFSEGLSSGGLWNRLPVVGHMLQRYQEYLFQDYIPRVKAAMYEHAISRAEDYYAKDIAAGKFTRDQLLENAAFQANNAFGELNYKYLGRDPTFQDALRLGLLAPDFLEARLKFAGAALAPKGKEQAMALIRSAAIMASSAQALNVLFGDDHKVDLEHPFTFKIGGREYGMRSVLGDLQHLVTDFWGFWAWRENPALRALWHVAHSEDTQGRSATFVDSVKDVLNGFAPIPAGEFLKRSSNPTDTWITKLVNGLMQSVGVTNYAFKTEAEKAASDISYGHRQTAPALPGAQARYDAIREIKDKYLSGELDGMGDVLRQARANGIQLTSQQIKEIEHSKRTEGKLTLQDRIKHFSLEETMIVWDNMTDAERKENMSFVLGKIARSDSTPFEQKGELYRRIRSEGAK